MKHRSRLSLLLMMTLVSAPVHAESKPVDLRWTELGPVITGQAVEFTTKEGVSLRGDVVSVRPEELVLDVKRTSNAQSTPKGGATIARSSLDSLRIVREKGRWGRRMGTTLGLVTGLTLGAYTAANVNDSAGPGIATFLAITGGTTVVGHFLGRAADRRATTIRIVP